MLTTLGCLAGSEAPPRSRIPPKKAPPPLALALPPPRRAANDSTFPVDSDREWRGTMAAAAAAGGGIAAPSTREASVLRRVDVPHIQFNLLPRSSPLNTWATASQVAASKDKGRVMRGACNVDNQP